VERRIGAVVISAGLLLSSASLPACESKEQQQIEKIQEDVGDELDKLEDQIDKKVDGNN
jgi:hypothetical protein